MKTKYPSYLCIILQKEKSHAIWRGSVVYKKSFSKLYTLGILIIIILSKYKINRTQSHNHLVHKWTRDLLAKLAKWLSYIVSTSLYTAFDRMFLSCHVHI